MARPWPNRYTRARLGGLKGFVVRPRMGPIINNDPDNPFGGMTVVAHAGWRDPFHDDEGEAIREDGVNLGTLVGGTGRAIVTAGDHLLRGTSIKRRKVATQGALNKGEVDWRSPDGKHVISWHGSPNRYAAGGTSPELYRRGKSLGGLPDHELGRPRHVFGAAVYRDAPTASTWLIVVAWPLQLVTDRPDNEYVEEVWMRRFSTAAQFEATTVADVDQKIAEFQQGGQTSEENVQLRQALEDELAKWIKVAELDVDPLLPAPPDGVSPKVTPRSNDLCPWLFNASGNECQTIRMITVNPNGDSDIQDFEPWDQRRLKVSFDISVSHEDVDGVQVYRPSVAVAEILGFPTLTGSFTESESGTKSGDNENGSFSGSRTLQADWDYTYAVDYVGDQEAFLTQTRSETLVSSADSSWSKDGEGNLQTTWSEESDRTVTVTHDVAGTLLQTTSTEHFTESGSKEETPSFTYKTGSNCTAEEGGVTGPAAADAEQIDDDDLNGIGYRWLDLRLGLLHYTRSNNTGNWSTTNGGTASKSTEEALLLDGAISSLQLDSDSTDLDPQDCDTNNLFSPPDSFSVDRDEAIDFYHERGLAIPDPSKYGRADTEYRAAWDRDHEGNVLGSALLGIHFTPYSGGFNQHPYGHETGYVRYDGAQESVQELFEIQPVEVGEVFVCYPLRFIGA